MKKQHDDAEPVDDRTRDCDFRANHDYQEYVVGDAPVGPMPKPSAELLLHLGGGLSMRRQGH